MTLRKLLGITERACLVTIFLTMVVLFFINIVVRTLWPAMASELAWVEEAVRLLNLFLVFGALGLALQRGRHVSIDSLRDRLGNRTRRSLYRCIDLTGLLASLYLSWLSFKLVRMVLATGQRSPTLDIPMGWIYAAPMIGFLLLALRYGMSLLQIIDRRSAATTAADRERQAGQS